MNFSKIKEKKFDVALFITILILSSFGLLMVYSTSSVYSLETFGNTSHFLKLHAIYLFIGLASMVLFMNIDYRNLRKLVYPSYFAVLIMLVLVLIPDIGREAGGARRWLAIGPFAFQPSEIAKFVILLYLAHSLTKKRDKLDSFFVGFFSHVAIAGAYVLLIFVQPDFGSSALILCLLLFMMFIGDVRFRYLIPLGVVTVIFSVFAIMSKGYRLDRITSFINPWSDPLGSGYQAVQSFIAFGLGGISGTGLGDSTQKLFFLPQAHTDFIFSIIGEEFGFIGVIIVIVLFAFILYRSLIISTRAPDLFGCYLVAGFILMITFQAGINMAVSVGLFPTKGLTLPFISYGGTSLVSCLSAMGIILNVSMEKEEK